MGENKDSFGFKIHSLWVECNCSYFGKNVMLLNCQCRKSQEFNISKCLKAIS